MPRSKNQFADTLATLASMLKILILHLKHIDIEVSDDLVYCLNKKKSLMLNLSIMMWKNFLKEWTYLSYANAVGKRTIRLLACQFFISSDNLYNSANDNVLLECVNAKEANGIITEIHEGACGQHMWTHVGT